MKKKTIIIIVIILALVLAGLYLFRPQQIATEDIQIATAKVEKGSVSKTVTATGTLEAIVTVEVGTQVSGIIEDIFVDFNSYVEKGQLLAKIDTTNLAAAMEQSQATLDNAKAELDYQQANFDRLAPLQEKKLISQSDFDQTLYNLNKAKASYKSALAQHKKNQINLDYALIHSPIDGIVLNRAVEEGQTVASSFSTPTLFSIANDLTQMQVEANVDEADIGQVKQGQRVEFTVDAYPNMVFDGEVTEVRLEPTISNNVVTYTIIISAPNPDYKLMPGMTAETEIYVQERKDVLVVPSKTLRFTPDQQLMFSYMGAPPKPENGESGENEGNMGERPEMMDPPQEMPGDVVWVINDKKIIPVPVKVGMNDDINAEILSGLKMGDEVLLEMTVKSNNTNNESSSEQSRNPFMPGPPPRR
jgi:HlyD family secretion protein